MESILGGDFCILPIVGCILLSSLFVLSLYVWQDTHLRDNPSVIKKRFLSVLITSALSPFAIFIFSTSDLPLKHGVLELLGLRLSGLFMAATVPLILTMILFLGPLTMQSQSDTWQLYSETPEHKVSNSELPFQNTKCDFHPLKVDMEMHDKTVSVSTDNDCAHNASTNSCLSETSVEDNSTSANASNVSSPHSAQLNNNLSNIDKLPSTVASPMVVNDENEPTLCKNDSEPMYWIDSCKDLIWLRDHVFAPFSEELTFRACMLPILIQCFRPQSAVFICPLFFGIAHFHHVIGRVKNGCKLKTAILLSGFQFLFTTMFGAYSAFLFLRTGHFIAPFLAHAFCNHLGFPNFREICSYEEPKRTLTFILCVIGLVSWCCLLAPLTNPHWYKNSIYWKV